MNSAANITNYLAAFTTNFARSLNVDFLVEENGTDANGSDLVKITFTRDGEAVTFENDDAARAWLFG